MKFNLLFLAAPLLISASAQAQSFPAVDNYATYSVTDAVDETVPAQSYTETSTVKASGNNSSGFFKVVRTTTQKGAKALADQVVEEDQLAASTEVANSPENCDGLADQYKDANNTVKSNLENLTTELGTFSDACHVVVTITGVNEKTKKPEVEVVSYWMGPVAFGLLKQENTYNGKVIYTRVLSKTNVKL